MSKSKLDFILEERGKTHGDYSLQAELSQEIKKTCELRVEVPPYVQESLDMIAHKMARIAAGNPLEPDHWRDIAGYATLAADRLDLLAEAKKKLPQPPLRELFAESGSE